MTIDIHKMITGNPISKNLLKLCGINYNKKDNSNSLHEKVLIKYTGPGNLFEKQVDFHPLTGQIYKVNDPPSSKNGRCSMPMFHDIKYTVAENIGKNSKDIKNRKLDADKEWLDCFKVKTPWDLKPYAHCLRPFLPASF